MSTPAWFCFPIDWDSTMTAWAGVPVARISAAEWPGAGPAVCTTGGGLSKSIAICSRLSGFAFTQTVVLPRSIWGICTSGNRCLTVAVYGSLPSSDTSRVKMQVRWTRPFPDCRVVPVSLRSVMIPRPGSPVSRSFLSAPPVSLLKSPMVGTRTHRGAGRT